jgi:hypothetical protein
MGLLVLRENNTYTLISCFFWYRTKMQSTLKSRIYTSGPSKAPFVVEVGAPQRGAAGQGVGRGRDRGQRHGIEDNEGGFQQARGSRACPAPRKRAASSRPLLTSLKSTC